MLHQRIAIPEFLDFKIQDRIRDRAAAWTHLDPAHRIKCKLVNTHMARAKAGENRFNDFVS